MTDNTSYTLHNFVFCIIYHFLIKSDCLWGLIRIKTSTLTTSTKGKNASVSKCLSPLHKSFCNSIVCTFTVLCACRSTSLGRKKMQMQKSSIGCVIKGGSLARSHSHLSLGDDQHFASICTKLQISPAPRGWRRIYFCKFSVPQRAVASHSLPIYICADGLTGRSVGR